MTEPQPSLPEQEIASARRVLGRRNLVFVGLMGAGKSAIGRIVAQMLDIPFVDSDHEIERVSRMSIPELFEAYGEAEFRALEARVIKRLLRTGPRVLSTGGGAFMNDATRATVLASGLSVWLKADLEVLWTRVSKRDSRPLLKTANPKQTLASLLEQRYPVYAEADVTVQSRDDPKETIAAEAIAAIARLDGERKKAPSQ
ncbi:shikimate kinase [Hoeflea olei]|uniref:Shikimate kinase n=1 Tax=Hoeflea olei TaxID=1480615 RepID=A0A1C1YXQ4_9HYPH|nr:shikimate kinase [Hoeflea olei]